MTKKTLLFISLMAMLSLYSFNGYNIPIAVSEVPVAGNHTYTADVSKLYNPGKNILLYVTRNWDGGSIRREFDTDLPAILAQDGFTVTVQGRDTLPKLSDTILTSYDQLWFVSTEGGAILDSEEVQAILEFHNNGKGILVIGDGCTYTGPANQFSLSLGVQFISSQCCDCDHCGGPIGCPISTSGFVPYDIWTCVSEIEANLNEGDLSATSPAQIIATHNGINMVAVRDADGGRVAWDATWYRFTDSTANPFVSIAHFDNAQYARNLAKWLARKYLCGDANADVQITVSDVVYLINYLFKGGPAPIPCLVAGGANGDSHVTVSDVVYLITYLFKGGPPPVC